MEEGIPLTISSQSDGAAAKLSCYGGSMKGLGVRYRNVIEGRLNLCFHLFYVYI